MASVTAILTHENPDLDSTLSIWLLRRFGELRYPGIKTAPLRFSPAGVIPGNQHPDDLEAKEGILVVDTGGGRLDTHSRDGVIDPKKRETSAAKLVAEDLGVADRQELFKILQFVTLQETQGRSIDSRQPMDHLVSLPNLLRGLNICHHDGPERIVELMMELYDAAFATELEWFQAKEDFKSATVSRLKSKARVVSMISDTGAALKVARLHKADLIIHRNTEGHTGITVRNKGILDRLNLAVIAEVVRLAEAQQEDEPVEYDQLRAYGVVHGWFLHDSGRILSKGSPKNRVVPPSRLDLGVLHALAVARLDASKPMPGHVCALTRSGEAECSGCAFDALALESCAANRDHVEKNPNGVRV